MAPLPSSWQNTLFGSLYRQPRSSQGDGGMSANGMDQMGQMGSFGSGGQMALPGQQVQRTPPPQGEPQGPALSPQGGPQTFAQMQASGLARPVPPGQMQQNITGQLGQAVSQALGMPSRYDLPQVQQVRDALTSQLNTQFGAQRKQIDEQMAQRGLLSSSIAGGYYGDLAKNQADALANMNAQLIQNQAATSAQDLSAGLNAGQSLQSALASQGQSQQQLDLNRMLGLGNLDIQQAGVTGQFGGQRTLESLLGLGGLGIQQQQANTQAQQVAGNLGLGQQAQALNEKVQSGQLSVEQANQQLAQLQNQQQFGLAGSAQNIQKEQFGQNLSLQQQAQALNDRVQSGQLTLAQASQQLASLQNAQQFGLQATAQANQAGQFGQTLGEQQAARGQQNQQFTVQQDLARLLGTGNLGVQQQQVANQASQFGQSLSLQQQAQALNDKVQSGQLTIEQANQQLAQLQNQQQFGLSGQDLALRQQLGLGNLGVQQQQVANQASQFGQTIDLQTKAQELDKQVRTGELTIAQANQELAKLTQANQNVLGLRAAEAQDTSITNQNTQFANTLAQQLTLGNQANATQLYGLNLQDQTNRNQLLYQVMGAMSGMDATAMKQLLANLGFKSTTPGGPGGGGGSGGSGGGDNGQFLPLSTPSNVVAQVTTPTTTTSTGSNTTTGDTTFPAQLTGTVSPLGNQAERRPAMTPGEYNKLIGYGWKLTAQGWMAPSGVTFDYQTGMQIA